MTLDPDDLPTADLEAALAAARQAQGVEDAWAAWLAAGVHPGRFPSVDTCSAYVLYRAWCDARGERVLEPFTFARLMLTRFRKRMARWDGQPRACYAVSAASAARLREASTARPATPADRALFSFAELRRAFNPALRHKDPDAAPQEE